MGRPGTVHSHPRPRADPHGGNRTGRVFTGDRSGDFIFRSLYRCGRAARPDSITAGDGQRLIGARMAAVVRCAPLGNKPTLLERDTCIRWLSAELRWWAPSIGVIVCLGGFAWQALWPVLIEAGYAAPRPRPPFGRGVEALLRGEDRADVPTCYFLATTRASITPLPAVAPKPCTTRSLAELVASRARLSHRAYLLMVMLNCRPDAGRSEIAIKERD